MQSPEKLRATALMLLDMANRTVSYDRQQELLSRAERLEHKAADLEMAETDHEARIRLLYQLRTETDTATLSLIRSALNDLEE